MSDDRCGVYVQDVRGRRYVCVLPLEDERFATLTAVHVERVDPAIEPDAWAWLHQDAEGHRWGGRFFHPDDEETAGELVALAAGAISDLLEGVQRPGCWAPHVAGERVLELLHDYMDRESE